MPLTEITTRTPVSHPRRSVAHWTADALRSGDSRVRDFAEMSAEWFWEQDADFRYTWFSDVERLPAFRVSAIGLTIWELVADAVAEETWVAHRAQLARREPFRDFRCIVTCENGAITHISISGKPVFDQNGAFSGYRGVGRDITAEVTTDEASRRANAEATCAEAMPLRPFMDSADRACPAGVPGESGSGLVDAVPAIEEHKQRDEKYLKSARSELIDAIESISEGFALFDSDDRYVLTNTKYNELYPIMADVFASGCTYEEMIREGIARGTWAVEGDPDAFAARLLAWHRSCERPMERQLFDGRWIRAAEQRTPSGGIVAIRTDITEEKRAEAALKAAREQLVDAIESISEGFALFDCDDRYVMTNTNYRRFYPDRADLFMPGTRYEEMLRASVARGRDLGGEDADTWIRKMVEWHQACGEPMERQGPDGRWIRQVERRTSDGGIVAIRTDITAVKKAEVALVRQVRDLEAAQERLEKLTGSLEVMTADLAAARDAAQEKAAALARSEARFRDFALTSSHWLWETDAQHCFTYVSEGVRAYGFSPDLLMGCSRLDIAADAAAWHEHRAVLERREPFRDFIYTWKNSAGREGVAAVGGDPVFGADGRFLGYRGTGRDITEQVSAENALREAMRAAQSASLAKTQFLANMSHELRTPLNAIIGFSEMIELALRGAVPAAYQEYGRLIHQSGEHLHAVINDILDLAKVDAGKFELRTETGVDPRQTAEACIALVRGHAEAAEISLSVAIEDRLPLLVADPTRLKQILLNLLSNAIKFTEPGGSVALGVCATEDGVAFEVRDTGLGMTPAEIEIALEPFGQVKEGMLGKQEGTGLGLPLARRLAELHGGSLRIDSEKRRGTVITVILPAPPRAGRP